MKIKSVLLPVLAESSVQQLTKRIKWLERERRQLEKELRYWQGVACRSDVR